MTLLSARRLPWYLFGFAAALVPPSLVFGVQALDADLPEGREPFLASIVVADFFVVLYGTVGALVASRRPQNPIGWILCFVSVSLVLVSFAWGYADHTLYGGGSLPAARFAAWLANWLVTPAIFVATASIFLLFPTGRPPSARWRPVMWMLSVLAVLTVVGTALKPGELFSFPTVDNPFGVGGPAGEVIVEIDRASDFAAIPTFLVALAAMLLRLRRARGEERQQVKWVAYAGALTCTSFALSFFLGVAAGFAFAADAFFLLGLAGVAAMPVAAGLAILRYRLYDIDVVIRRTLVYGALTAALALAYVGGVLLLQLILRPVTEESDLAIAGSTLAVAALFRPLRGRIQRVVDRRFYRRRYDAARTLDVFSARLRDELDLDAVGVELAGVVRDTMHPTHVSLWLRKGAGAQHELEANLGHLRDPLEPRGAGA